MNRRDPFALPPVTPSRTASIVAAYAYVTGAHDVRADARDVVKNLVAQFGASLTYPTYRTALRCGDIYSEGATWCALLTAKILLDSFMGKAHQYLVLAEASDRPMPGIWRS